MKNLLKSKNLIFKFVEEKDAEFILELRKNENLNKYIHSTDITVFQQKEWIKKYKIKEKEKQEYYFRIDTIEGEKLGFVRIYAIDYDKKEFTWGSWIMKPERPKFAAIESALIIYEFAFKYLNMEKSIFDVRRKNEKVLAFHDRFGATKTGENDLDVFYVLEKEKYFELREERYKQFLNEDKTLKLIKNKI